MKFLPGEIVFSRFRIQDVPMYVRDPSLPRLPLEPIHMPESGRVKCEDLILVVGAKFSPSAEKNKTSKLHDWIFVVCNNRSGWMHSSWFEKRKVF